jgi:hypothetical protein
LSPRFVFYFLVFVILHCLSSLPLEQKQIGQGDVHFCIGDQNCFPTRGTEA